jgi:hypothetical protein
VNGVRPTRKTALADPPFMDPTISEIGFADILARVDATRE